MDFSTSDQRRKLSLPLKLGLGLTLAVVVLAPETAAWHGLLGLAQDRFGLTGGWQYVVPLSAGVAAFYTALLAVRHVLEGDSATSERALTWAYASGGAALNYWYEASQGKSAAALYFGAASLSSALLWDRTLRAWRRDELRDMGALEQPLPRFRALRWVVAPGETFGAWKLAITEGITVPAEALARARSRKNGVAVMRSAATEIESGGSDVQELDAGSERRRLSVEAGQRPGGAGGHLAGGEAAGVGGELGAHGSDLHSERDHGVGDVHHDGDEDLTDAPSRELVAQIAALPRKSDAVRWAFDTLGERDIPAALELLARYGLTVDRSYAYTVQWAPAKAELRAIAGGDR